MAQSRNARRENGLLIQTTKNPMSLQDTIARARAQVTAVVKPKPKAATVTAERSKTVKTPHGTFYASPATSRYLATKAMLERLDAALKSYPGTMTGEEFAAELNAVAELHGEADRRRGQALRDLAAAVVESSPAFLTLALAIREETKMRLYGLSGLLDLREQAPDSFTVAAPPQAETIRPPSDTRTYSSRAAEVGPNRKVGG